MSRAPGTPSAARLAEKHLLTTLLPLIAVLSASISTLATLIELAGALNPREESSAARIR
jgi:hypothetical protein